MSAGGEADCKGKIYIKVNWPWRSLEMRQTKCVRNEKVEERSTGRDDVYKTIESEYAICGFDLRCTLYRAGLKAWSLVEEIMGHLI